MRHSRDNYKGRSMFVWILRFLKRLDIVIKTHINTRLDDLVKICVIRVVLQIFSVCHYWVDKFIFRLEKTIFGLTVVLQINLSKYMGLFLILQSHERSRKSFFKK
jgi:hypothetical protein